MKRKKFLALALAGVITAATLTACTPLEDLYDWFFGGGSGSASRGNGVNLVEVSPEQKTQIMRWFGLNDGDVTTTPDRSRKALEEVVGKLNAATMMDSTKNELNATGKKALNEVAKNQLPQNSWSGMCIDVMKLSPASAAAAAAATPAIPDADRKLYWARYTHGNGGTFGVGAAEVKPGEPPVSDQPTYESDLKEYWFVSANASIYNRKEGSKVDFFAGTFTKDGETYLAVAAIWELSW